MLPPIRYPLPTLVALVLAGVLAWKGAEWSSDWRASIAARARRALEGPPIPNSTRPRVVAGPITRRALLLREETPVSTRPRGSMSQTLDRRMFVDVYDTWPDPGPTTHVRIGNRGPIGWVSSSDVLLWDTRLVIRPPDGRLSIADTRDGPSGWVDVGESTIPVLAREGEFIEVAVWEKGHPWSSISSRGWVRVADLPRETWGVWISQVELPILLRLALDGDPNVVRLRAVLGRLSDSRPLSPGDVEAARPALPPVVFEGRSDPRIVTTRLAQANNHPASEISWSGLSFRFLPLTELP